MGYDVFIGYSHRDKEQADILLDACESKNIKCWIAPRDIIPGGNWANAIEDAIKECKIYIFLFSSISNHSRQILREIELAIAKGLIVLPVRIDQSNPANVLRYYLSALQWIDATEGGIKGNIERILRVTEDIIGPRNKKDAINKNDSQFDYISSSMSSNNNVVLDRGRFEAYSGNKPYAFISYSHEDTDIVIPIIKDWHDKGYRIWYDEGIDPGNEWRKFIAQKLNDSVYFVIFISPDSVASKNVKRELYFADKYDIPFLAIHLKKTKLPLDIDLTISSHQGVMKYRMSENDFAYKMKTTLPRELID